MINCKIVGQNCPSDHFKHRSVFCILLLLPPFLVCDLCAILILQNIPTSFPP